MAFKQMLRSGLLAATALVASIAFAADHETFTLAPPDLPSDGTLASPEAGTTVNFTSTGGYSLGKKIKVSGTFTKVQSGDYASEARLVLTAPNSTQIVLGPFTGTTSYSTPITINQTLYIDALDGMNPTGGWTCRAYESYDDGGHPNTDKTWNNLTITFTDEGVTPPSSSELGTISTDTSVTDDYTPGTPRWYHFTIAEGTATWGFLDIDTEGTTTFLGGTFANDTYIGLFSNSGTYLGIYDDDDGSDFLSQLTFGPGAGDRGNGGYTGMNYDGRDGDLAAGSYYLCVSGYPTTFGNNYTATTSFGHSGQVQLNFRTPGGGGGGGGSDVSGQVTLNNLDPIGGPAGEVCHWQVRDGVTDAILDEGDTTLNLGGNYVFHTTVSSGNHTITMKGATWLRVATFGVTMGGPVGGQNFVLENGDCDGNDIVDLGDFDILAAGFGYGNGDAGYIPASDLDQNDVTDLGDFDILAFQFGNAGYGD